MERLFLFWHWISNLGINHDDNLGNNREIISLNRINLLVVIISLIAFLSSLIHILFFHARINPLGPIRLFCMLVTGLVSLYLTTHKRQYIAKVITSFFPAFFLIILPTMTGIVRIESYFYYPFAGSVLAIIPILVFSDKTNHGILMGFIIFYFFLSVTADNLLTYFSGPATQFDIFQDRYIFYKLSQVLLFLFIVPTVFTLKELNTKHETLLLEQKSVLVNQKEELEFQSGKLKTLNDKLVELNSQLVRSNLELEGYRDHLEELVELRTADLKESELKFRGIFENANDAIFIMKEEIFYECNRKSTEIFGCRKEQIIGKSPYYFSPAVQPDGSDSKENTMSKVNSVLNGSSLRFEWQHVRYDQSLFDADVSLNRFDLRGKMFILAIVRDVTIRKKAEAMLRDSEKKFRNIFDNSIHPIIILDTDYRILDANRAFYLLSGLDLLEDKPIYITDFVAENQSHLIRERLAYLHLRGSIAPQEYKVKLKNGEFRTIEANSTIIEYSGKDAFLVFIRDVTDIKEAEYKIMEAVINTEESERSRFAQDLHDGLGPVLSTIKIFFQVYQDMRDKKKKSILNDKLNNAIEESIKGVSEISHNISPHVLRNYGFYAALRQFVQNISFTNIIDISLDFGTETFLNENTGIILYRSITELINNSIKHSACSSISIILRHDAGIMQVDFTDNGKGFDVTSIVNSPAFGSGIKNIQNRIKALHGEVMMSSVKGNGMHALIRIPV